MCSKFCFYIYINKNTKNMKYIHHVVTTGDRDITKVEVLYTNSNTPKFSMKTMVDILENVQYEIIDRDTNKIEIVKSN